MPYICMYIYDIIWHKHIFSFTFLIILVVFSFSVVSNAISKAEYVELNWEEASRRISSMWQQTHRTRKKHTKRERQKKRTIDIDMYRKSKNLFEMWFSIFSATSLSLRSQMGKCFSIPYTPSSTSSLNSHGDKQPTKVSFDNTYYGMLVL